MFKALKLSTGPILTLIAFVALWEVGCRLLNVPDFVLPPPSEITYVLIRDWGIIWPNAVQTLWTTMIGFAVAVGVGLLLGLMIGVSPSINRNLSPLLVGFNSVPKVALVPVLVLWFGVGTVPAIVTAFLVAFFPIVVNVAAGIATIEVELVDVLRSLGASQVDILLKAGLPRSLPYFFASLKVAVTLAFVGSIISETVAANSGIGYLMVAASAAFKIPLLFASLVFIALLGMALYGIAALIERRVTPWAFRAANAGGATYATGG
ncbi:MAG: ABC transporter permease [Ktedonobacteraceae bacterium]